MSTFGRPFSHEATRQCTLIRLPGAECDDPATTRAIDTAVRSVLADPGLRLGGVVADLGRCTDSVTVGARVEAAIARMDDVVRAYGLIVTTLVLECEHDPTRGAACDQHRQLLDTVEDALDTACARYRFPRPTVTVVLRTAAPAPDPTPVPAVAALEPLLA